MDNVNWLLGLFGLFLFIISMPYVITWANLAFTRLQPVRCRVVEAAELPAGLAAAAGTLRDKLESFGLVYQGAVANRSICFDLAQESFSLVFLDSERRIMASLTETSHPGSLRMFEVVFYSRLANGQVLYTTDCHGHQMFQLPDTFILQDGYSGDIEKQWQLHNARLNGNPAAPDSWSAEPFADSAQNMAGPLPEIADWLQTCYTAFFDYWLAKKIILRLAPSVYFPNPWYLTGFTRDLIRGQKAAIACLQSVTAIEPPADQRFLLERQLAFQRGGNAISKILLLVVSLVTFYVAFGLIFSWVLVPMLLVALLIHEYGHYLAMRYCGYRNTQIFFLPLLGAVTTGQKTDPKIGQELLVYLAGPIPGIVLGLALLFSPWVESWPWLREFALVCFILNFINLLPLVPLDGGRVVEKLLFARFASARLVFYVLSTIGFAVAAWYTRDFILGFLTVATAFLAKNEWRKRRILLRIQQHHGDFFRRSGEEKRELIMADLCAVKLGAGERFVFARDLLANHSGAVPTLPAAVLGMVLYLGVLGAATAGAVYAATHGGFAAGALHDDFDEAAYYSAEFWREAIADEQDYGGADWHSLLQAVRVLSAGPNPADAEEFTQRIEQRVQNLSEPDLRLAQWRLLKPDTTGVPLVADDVAYIRRNVLQSHGEPYEKATALIDLLDTRALLKDAERLSIIAEALDLLAPDPDADPDTLAGLYHRQGQLQQSQGQGSAARASYELGFAAEIRSEYVAFDDANYAGLLDLYFAAGEYTAALDISNARLAALENAEHEASEDYFIRETQRQRAWLLLLTQDETASDEFAALQRSYQSETTSAGVYDKTYLEHVLEVVYSFGLQQRDASAYIDLLHRQTPEHIQKFIRGCNCKNRGAFDTYRHEQYLETLAELGFKPAAGAN